MASIPSNADYVSMSGEAAIMALIKSQLQGVAFDTDKDMVDFVDLWTTLTLSPSTSTATLTTNALSTYGVVGQYTGSVNLPYQKRSIEKLLPYPLVVKDLWPTNWQRLQNYLSEHYGVWFDDGELLDSEGNALAAEVAVDDTPDEDTGYVTFLISSNSIRYKPGEAFRVYPVTDRVRSSVERVLGLSSGFILSNLTDHTASDV